MAITTGFPQIYPACPAAASVAFDSPDAHPAAYDSIDFGGYADYNEFLREAWNKYSYVPASSASYVGTDYLFIDSTYLYNGRKTLRVPQNTNFALQAWRRQCGLERWCRIVMRPVLPGISTSDSGVLELNALGWGGTIADTLPDGTTNPRQNTGYPNAPYNGGYSVATYYGDSVDSGWSFLSYIANIADAAFDRSVISDGQFHSWIQRVSYADRTSTTKPRVDWWWDSTWITGGLLTIAAYKPPDVADYAYDDLLIYAHGTSDSEVAVARIEVVACADAFSGLDPVGP